MNLDKYPVFSVGDRTVYEFLSEGPKGTIKKFIHFEKLDENFFNLAFGDWDEQKQKIDDNTKSNNSDRDKVLATVAYAVIDFMARHTNAMLFAQGITPVKTRLYQMGINRYFQEINQLYSVSGYYKDNWEPFEPNKNYDAFSLIAK